MPEGARAQHLALAESDAAEVIAGRTALMPREGLKVSVIDKAPRLHQPSLTEPTYYSRSERFCNGSAQIGGKYDRTMEAPGSCMSHL